MKYTPFFESGLQSQQNSWDTDFFNNSALRWGGGPSASEVNSLHAEEAPSNSNLISLNEVLYIEKGFHYLVLKIDIDRIS